MLASFLIGVIVIIQLNQTYFDEINKEKIDELLSLVEPYFAHRIKLYDRYRRKSTINEFMKSQNDGVLLAFEHLIVNEAKGYLAGKEPVYSFVERKEDKDKEYQSTITDIRNYNDDASIFSELMHDYLTTGAAYLYLSENANNVIKYIRMDSRNTVVVYDYSADPNIIAMVRLWEESTTDGKKEKRIEITTAEYKRIYDKAGTLHKFTDFVEGVLQPTTKKEIYWGQVPITAFEHVDGIAVFEPSLGLIDAYEQMLMNIKNMTQYNDDGAKLVLKNMRASQFDRHQRNPETGEVEDNPEFQREENNLLRSRTIEVMDGGDVKWLEKPIQYEGSLAFLTKLEELIFMMASVPNMADRQFAGNASGISLKYKLYALDQLFTATCRIFKKGYGRHWDIVTDRINLRKDTAYNSSDIIINFNTNAPDDKKEDMDRAVAAHRAALLSHETCISISGVEIDPAQEMERIQQEMAVELETKTTEPPIEEAE